MNKLITLMLICILTSCSSYLAEEEENTDSSESMENIPVSLNVRSGSPDVDIIYPINVYIFNESGNLVREDVINESRAPLDIKLSKGNYTLSAFTGLNHSDYSYPEELTQTTTITHRQGEPCKTALQYGSSSFHLEKKTDISIHMEYIVTSLEFKFSEVPADVRSVSINISPTSQGVKMNGQYTNDGASTRLTCQKQGDFWVAGPTYVLPSHGSKTILTLEVEKPDGNQNLSYSYTSQLQPAQPYRFSGKYSEGIKLNGNFECDGWKPGIDIEFDFSEEGEQEGGGNKPNNPDQPGGDDNEGNIEPDYSGVPTINCNSLPAAGDFWKGFYVWKSNTTSSRTATAVLLSKKQWFNILAANGMALLSEYVDESLGNWRVFTEDEAREFNTQFASSMNILNGQLHSHGQDEFYYYNKERYLCNDCKSAFYVWGKLSLRAAGKTTKYYMRGLKDVKFQLAE